MHEKISNGNDWNLVFNRTLVLSPSDRATVYALYDKIGKSCPDAYNHQCMEAALVEFEISSGRMQMMDGALEYEEAMAGAELIRGEG